jgi:hypothetical protein
MKVNQIAGLKEKGPLEMRSHDALGISRPSFDTLTLRSPSVVLLDSSE